MNANEIVDSNLKDLNVALDFVEDTKNDFLKEYINNRIAIINKNKTMYQYVTISTLLESYIVDLQLFINISNLINDIESKDYFKGRIVELIKKFSYLANRKDIVSLL